MNSPTLEDQANGQQLPANSLLRILNKYHKVMIAIKLAIKNILGAGWRSLLNIAVLSLAFVIIIWHNGTIDGWNQQARKDTQGDRKSVV